MSNLTPFWLYTIFVVYHAGHAIGGKTTNQCKWEILNNTSTADSSIFTFSCNVDSLNATPAVVSTIREREFHNKIQLTLRCRRHIGGGGATINDGGHIEKLGQLNNLVALSVEACHWRRIAERSFERLPRLQRLTLRNFDESSLELVGGSFGGLSALESLDLAFNNIWTVPTDALCSLISLESLNLSHNLLTGLSEMDFAVQGNRSCVFGALEVLDVSHNKLTYISAYDLSSLRTLKTLLIANNRIAEIHEDAFAALLELETLDLSHNRLLALAQTLFKSNKNLIKLSVQNNSLSSLTLSVFEEQTRLEQLDLSVNLLTSFWVKGFIFTRLSSLLALNLAQNSIERIDHYLLVSLKGLRVLSMERNKIEYIDENAFINLRELKILNLSHNKLRSLERMLFSKPMALSQLFLESNFITNIHSDLFRNLPQLQDLNLNGNLLIELPHGLGQLGQLKSLDLGKNNIHFIDGAKLNGLSSLLGLRLVDNFITNLTSTCFAHLPALHVLNLASNRLRFIDPLTFRANPALHAIRLDNNEINDISSAFQSLSNLVWLNLSDNRLREFDYNYIPSTVEWLDMHKNLITSLGDYEMQRANLRLTYLNVAQNQLSYLNDLSVPDNVETANFSHNTIVDIASATFRSKSRLRWIDLRSNRIKTLPSGALKNNSTKMEIFLDDNPLECDCTMEWLQRSITTTADSNVAVVDVGRIECRVGNFRAGVNRTKPLLHMAKDEFLCQYETHCFALCHCCEFDACDCEMICPTLCECFFDETWRLNIVDCGRAEYYDIPKNIPMDATAIYLDANDMGALGSHIFIGKKKLEVLFLNHSQIVSLHNRTFSGIPSLRILHLEHNQIREINEVMLDALPNLEHLYLQHNLIEYFAPAALTVQQKLRTLHLAHNRIKSLKFLEEIPISLALTESHFRDNPWDCQCLESAASSKATKAFARLCPAQNCLFPILKDPTTQDLEDRFVKREYIQTLAAIVVALIGTTFLLTLACIFRANFALWLYSRWGIRLTKDPTASLDRHRTCDAAILFNHRDSDFVYRVLTVELERNGYKVCHQSKVLASGGFSYESFLSNVNIARRLIIVLSSKFLSDEWRSAEFRIAVQNYVYKLNYRHRPFRIVLIIAVPLDLILIDPILEVMVKSCSRLFWGERNFWRKLKFAMPDCAAPYEKGGGKLGDQFRESILRPECGQAEEEDQESLNDASTLEIGAKYDTQTYVNQATGHIYTTIAQDEPPDEVLHVNNSRAYYV